MQPERPVPNLSPREHQLLDLAAEGLTDLAIAERLGISEATVGTYWGRVRIKFGPYNRTELVALMMRAQRDVEVKNLQDANDSLVHEIQIDIPDGNALTYREIIEAAPEAILVVSEAGLIEFANQAVAEIFGYSTSELIGQDHNFLVPERYREIHGTHVEHYLDASKRHLMGDHVDTPALKKDGTESPIRASLSVLHTNSERLVICFVREVTDIERSTIG